MTQRLGARRGDVPVDVDRVAVAAYSDGTLRWHRMTDGAEVLAFFPHSDGERWVAWTPEGPNH